MTDQAQPTEHRTEFEVRDYELDAQAVVNNGVYFGYFEHARHRWLMDQDVDFVELHSRGIDPVVVEANIRYDKPLVSGDRFVVATSVRKQGALRYIFDQRIERTSTGDICTQATITAAILKNGRPARLPELDALL